MLFERATVPRVLPGSLSALVLLVACSRPAPESVQAAPPGPTADIVSVRAAGEAGAYRFEVGIRSPDEGCDQYADWWEVVAEDGMLIHRRVLGHSHITEQPFVRAGAPVSVQANEVVWVRAHMHPTGYGGTAFRGSVQNGFRVADLAASFAADLAGQPPQPPDCAN